jgi:hypothetical protein
VLFFCSAVPFENHNSAQLRCHHEVVQMVQQLQVGDLIVSANEIRVRANWLHNGLRRSCGVKLIEERFLFHFFNSLLILFAVGPGHEELLRQVEDEPLSPLFNANEFVVAS